VSGRYRVFPTVSFQADIERLEEHIIERELQSHTPDDSCLFRFRDAVDQGIGILSFAPQTCRRSEAHRDFRELIIPFGRGGCVVLFAVRDDAVFLLAARDQHEHDYR
jgi:hypothetical protein